MMFRAIAFLSGLISVDYHATIVQHVCFIIIFRTNLRLPMGMGLGLSSIT